MPLFPYLEEAEAFLAAIHKNPEYSYTILPITCGSGYSVEVRDADGILVTEAYGSEEEIAETLAERKRRTEDARRRGGKFR